MNGESKPQDLEVIVMSQANPYAKFLDGRSVETILASTPAEIAALLDAIGEGNAASRPEAGKWSAAEIVCHLADCETVDAFRLRQTLAEDGPTLNLLWNEKKWAAAYPGISARQALEVFTTLRGWNLRLILSALPEAAARPAFHPERGALTFQTLVETRAGHDLNHLGQLRKIAQAK
jgi:hypothetical protein